MDIAASIQKVTEEIVLRTGRHVHKETGSKNLVMAGGVALNCVANGRLLREGPFDQIWIQPAAGDAGGALGAAMLIWHQLLDKPRQVGQSDSQSGSFLGPNFTGAVVERFLQQQGAVYKAYASVDEMIPDVAELLAKENVVGWMQGRMEFGPRALGGRSILGDARSPEMQSVMNLKIKFRESFRPFAPSVLKESVHEYFETREQEDSPYMLLVADVRQDKRTDVRTNGLKGLDKLKVRRSVVPAITHVDYSARVQTVDAERNAAYHKLISEFNRRTGCPVVINTSFNVRGEPIVCSPEHAYRCFMATNMDVLVVDRFVLLKKAQPDATHHGRDEYLAQFKLD